MQYANSLTGSNKPRNVGDINLNKTGFQPNSRTCGTGSVIFYVGKSSISNFVLPIFVKIFIKCIFRMNNLWVRKTVWEPIGTMTLHLFWEARTRQLMDRGSSHVTQTFVQIFVDWIVHNCMQNGVMLVRHCLTSFRKKTIVYYWTNPALVA